MAVTTTPLIANGIRTQLSYIQETVMGQTPANPTFKQVRNTSRNINLTKNLLESEEVAAHGQETDVRHGFNRVDGTIGGELITGAFDDFIEAGLAGTWSNALTGTATVSATAPATFTRSSGNFVSDGLMVGDFIRVSGFTNVNNNNVWLITALTTTTITVAVGDTVLTTEASGGTATISGKRCDMALDVRTFAIERSQADIGQYQMFNGVGFNGINVSIQPEAIVKLSFPIIGLKALAMAQATASTGGAPTAPASGSPYDSFSGAIMEGGVIVGYVTGLELNINLNRNLQAVVGSKFSPSIFEGRRMVGGTMNFMFQNATTYNKYINETETSVGFMTRDPNGTDFQGIYMPRVKINGAPMDPGQTGPVIMAAPIRALYSATRGTTLSWFRSNAV